MNSKTAAKLNAIEPSILFLIIAILIGGYIRFLPALQSNFPLNDGGMFYSMTKDLIANGFRIPMTISYNHLDLPFAYPPLAFYFTGLLASVTSWQLIDIFRIFPAVFSILSIPAFYLLAKSLIKDKYQLIIAILVFAFVPTSFDWLVMGGGVTRSLGFFFLLLSLYFIYRLYTSNQPLNILWTVLFSALTILSHPEAALHLVVSALVFFVFFGRNKKGLAKSILVAALTMVATAPWWGTVVMRQGFAPFFTAGQTGDYTISGFFNLLRFDLTNEYGLQIIGAFGLIGLFWCIAKREYFLPVWFIATFLSEPRAASLYLVPSLSILAAYSLASILSIFNKASSRTTSESNEGHLFSSTLTKVLMALLLFQWIYSATETVITATSSLVLSDADLKAFAWIQQNTPKESRFLLLTFGPPFTDPAAEWFPALTDRVSVSTVQGNEWNGDVRFDQILNESIKVQYCLYQTCDCVAQWAASNQKEINYLYIHTPISDALMEPSSTFESGVGATSLNKGSTELVYKDENISIYKVEQGR